jgi:hypothetical protein
VTTGYEDYPVAFRIADDAVDLPKKLFADSTYGRQHIIVIDQHRSGVLPLVDPGQRASRSRDAHAAWASASAAL